MQSTLIATKRKQRPSRQERAEVSRLVRLALRCRAEALERKASPDLIKHGDWCFDRALFARRQMRERGIPQLIERVKRDLSAAFEAYRHAIFGVYLPADNELPRLLSRANAHRTAAKSGRKITI